MVNLVTVIPPIIAIVLASVGFLIGIFAVGTNEFVGGPIDYLTTLFSQANFLAAMIFLSGAIIVFVLMFTFSFC
jgi:hypothetical protein